VRQVVGDRAGLIHLRRCTPRRFYVLASRGRLTAPCSSLIAKEAFKEAVLRPGERVAVWDYEKPRTRRGLERDEKRR